MPGTSGTGGGQASGVLRRGERRGMFLHWPQPQQVSGGPDEHIFVQREHKMIKKERQEILWEQMI